MEFKIIYEDEDILVIDKPAGVNSDDFEKRVHRLDKDTSGVFLIAKNDKALEFLQKQFQERNVEKRYTALIVGHLKNSEGTIKTLLSRSPNDRRKQKTYSVQDPDADNKREAETEYKVLQEFQDYTMITAVPKTGRKHQIRAHMAYLGHPIAGDKLYGFKNQPSPAGLTRQFLHASYLKIQIPDGSVREFIADLPEDLKQILNKLQKSI